MPAFNRRWLGPILGLTIVLSPVAAWAQAASELTLAEALARASSASPTLTAAEAEVAAARGRAQQAGLLPNPELDLSVENFAGTGEFGGLGGSEASLVVAQRFEFGGKRSARRTAAEAEIETARLRLMVARADLEKDVRDAFAESLAARSRVDLARDQFVRAEELSRVATTLVEVGREPPLRSLRARTAALEAVAAVRAAEARFAEAQRALAALWGDSAEAPDPVASEELPPAPSFDPANVIDVRLAEAEVAASVAAVNRERSVSRPDVTLSVGARSFRATDDTAVIFGATMPLGVFDRNQGGIAAANADRIGAEARRNAALAAAIRRSRDASAALNTSDARVTFLRDRAEPESIEAVRIAREGFAAGKFTLLDVLDAEGALNTVQSELINAQLERAQAIAALIRASEAEGNFQ
tara:strand:+ start:2579 stop:3820 length:1242 start_codon:yes stop_codon:yes gene_type:complete